MGEEELTPWDIYKKTGSLEKPKDAKPWDILKPSTEWLSKEESDARHDICKACPELIKLTDQCRKCGCFMSIKSKIKHATCPMGKW